MAFLPLSIDQMVPPSFAPFHLFSPTNFPLMTNFENSHNHNNNTTHHNSLHDQHESPTTITINQTLSTSNDPTTLVHDSTLDKSWLRLTLDVDSDIDVHHNDTEYNHYLPQPSDSGALKLNESLGVRDLSQRLVFLQPQLESDVVRVIDPPRRPHSGIWFSLQPLELSQEKQPALPQRSSSYMRIKDGRMTLRLLIKYLVKNLRLDSESEVEVSCRGEKLEPWLTMQQIRDNIWCSKLDASFTLLPHSSTIHHIMILHYSTPNSS